MLTENKTTTTLTTHSNNASDLISQLGHHPHIRFNGAVQQINNVVHIIPDCSSNRQIGFGHRWWNSALRDGLMKLATERTS
jgi:hypothetical protein